MGSGETQGEGFYSEARDDLMRALEEVRVLDVR